MTLRELLRDLRTVDGLAFSFGGLIVLAVHIGGWL